MGTGHWFKKQNKTPKSVLMCREVFEGTGEAMVKGWVLWLSQMDKHEECRRQRKKHVQRPSGKKEYDARGFSMTRT